MQHCWKSHVAVHMYVLQYMHEYTVSIDGTLISNLIFLLLVLSRLNISTCYWCSFLRINTLSRSTPYKAVTVQLPPNFVLSLIFTVHYQMQSTVIKLTQWYRFVGNRVRDIFLVRTKMFYPCFQQQIGA